MSILSQLSSQRRERGEASNRKVMMRCLDDPLLLEEIAAGLQSGNPKLTGDCAEVMTMVGEEAPELVAPYAPLLAKLVAHPKTRARWEAVHALANITQLVPEVIEPLLPRLGLVAAQDESVIARDYAAEIFSRFAAHSPEAARLAYPYLLAALTQWQGKHAHHALPGLAHAAAALPERRAEICAAVEPLLGSPKGVVRAAARKVLEAIG